MGRIAHAGSQAKRRDESRRTVHTRAGSTDTLSMQVRPPTAGERVTVPPPKTRSPCPSHGQASLTSTSCSKAPSPTSMARQRHRKRNQRSSRFPETPGTSIRGGVKVSVEREPKVSPVYWAAAVVWSLPGGVGGWLLLRKTHPRTARKLLLVGIASFVVIVAVVAVAIANRNAWSSSTYITK